MGSGYGQELAGHRGSPPGAQPLPPGRSVRWSFCGPETRVRWGSHARISAQLARKRDVPRAPRARISATGLLWGMEAEGGSRVRVGDGERAQRTRAEGPDYLRSPEMTEVMMNAPSMEEMGLSPRKDGLSYQIFPDPSDFDRCGKLKDRLPSIVVEPTEGEVESGELRWPPEEFLVQEDEQDGEETAQDDKE
ncbi:protein LBH [Carlito syrichta]|uniref:Protein LBH n=1 Tax=Carlito syrichta TaxID=1868482 RepID=A0A3Q0DYF7_CARSF|nr:protein LBH [Carlito syrichta]